MPPPGPPPYPQAYPPPYYPVPKKDNTLLIIVVILVVVFVVVPAIIAVWFFVVVAPLVPNPTTPPTVTFGTVDTAPGNASILIDSVSSATPYGFFQVNLRVNGVLGTAETVRESPDYAAIVISGATYRVSFEDAGGTVYLNAGDSFLVTGDGVPLDDGNYQFLLLWIVDGSQVASATWQIIRTMGVSISPSADGTNWTLLFVSVPSGLSTATTTLAIFDTGGAPVLAATSFATLSYGTHRAAYFGDADGTVEVGERLLISTSTYPTGYQVEIADNTRRLFSGTLL